MVLINLVAAIIIFNVLILVYQIIIEIFSVLFRLSGVNFDKAKFQVISMLTGTGFTTSESEAILLTKRRRNLAQGIMLFSYIFNISIVSIIVNLFASTSNTNITEVKICILLVVINLMIMLIIGKFQPIRKFIDAVTTKLAHRKYSTAENYITVYDTYGKKVVAEVDIRHLNEDIEGLSIKEFGLKSNYHIQLLIIKREEEIISEITPDTVINNNDILIVFGKLHDIKRLFIKNKSGHSLEPIN